MSKNVHCRVRKLYDYFEKTSNCSISESKNYLSQVSKGVRATKISKGKLAKEFGQN